MMLIRVGERKDYVGLFCEKWLVRSKMHHVYLRIVIWPASVWEKGRLSCHIGQLYQRKTTKQNWNAKLLFTLTVWPSYLLSRFQYSRLIIPI